MRLSVKVIGDIQKDMDRLHGDLARAVKTGVNNAGNGLKQELRGQTRAAGLGAGVTNAWRNKVYPQGRPSVHAAALVFTKAPQIIRAFDRGGIIRGKDGIWLAIPTKNAPKRIANNKRITPTLYEQYIGKLRFVFRRGKHPLLVADNYRPSYSRKTGELRGFKPASARMLERGRGITSVVMFTLVRLVKLPKRLNIKGAGEKWVAKLPSLIKMEL